MRKIDFWAAAFLRLRSAHGPAAGRAARAAPPIKGFSARAVHFCARLRAK